MAPTRVIRIDDEVWVELQRRARPLENTPNSVLRRVFGLPEQENGKAVDDRVLTLMGLVQRKTGKKLPLSSMEKGYALSSRDNEPIVFIRPQQQRLRVTASKRLAQDAGLTGWHRERVDRMFNGVSVRWYASDGDEAAYEQVAAVLARLCRHAAAIG